MFVKRVSSRFFKQKTPTCWTQKKKSSHLCTWPIHLQCEPASSYARLMQHAVVPPSICCLVACTQEGLKVQDMHFAPTILPQKITLCYQLTLAFTHVSLRSVRLFEYPRTCLCICECVQIVNVLICVLLIKSHVTM